MVNAALAAMEARAARDLSFEVSLAFEASAIMALSRAAIYRLAF
jgi:hypothetical protein